MYLPTQGSSEDLSVTIDECAEIINDREEDSFNIVCGDFNGDVGHLGGSKSNKKPTKNGMEIIKFFKEFSLFPANLDKRASGPVNTFKGAMGKSTIDYIAIPLGLSDNLVDCEVLKDNCLNTSDHYAVKARIKLACLPRMVQGSKPEGRIKWNKPGLVNRYRDSVGDYIANFTRELDDDLCNPNEIDDCIGHMVTHLNGACKNFSRTRFRKNVRPYWNPELNRLKRNKVNCHRLWKEAGRPRDPLSELFINHKKARKDFMRELKRVQKDYERKEIDDIVSDAYSNKDKFWKRVKKSRKSNQSDVFAVRNNGGEVAYNINEVVGVWRDHFERISLPRQADNFDSIHFEHVTQQVRIWANDDDEDEFLNIKFTEDEIRDGLKVLKKRKAAGCDGLTTEHLVYAGDNLVKLLTVIYNAIIRTEYVPVNFRRGTQIPLFKGKNLCPLDVNNYRGITLLSCMNKLFEVIIWGRLKQWWEDETIISPLQGACRKGTSCLHSALILQEAIAAGLDTKKKVFVAFFDAAKAFDSVWTDGLFFQLRNAGIVGRTWRILYKSYIYFKCKVRLAGTYSTWYDMKCGIHQGGFLSLLKYAAFIDPLLREIENSDYVCRTLNIPSSPVGYADDLSLCSLSKHKLDGALRMVYVYSCKWRFFYNAGKSAIMVYGENKREAKRNSKDRSFLLGKKKVKEKVEYDHVGVKCCLFSNYLPRTEDRISRGRRAFHAISSIGIKDKGVNMSVCTTIFWAIIMPIVTYGAELWVLQPDETEKLCIFQRYIARRCQRFPKRSPNYSSVNPLGWTNIDSYIKVKKLLFLRTILVMPDQAVCKRILVARSAIYREDPVTCSRNDYDSPIFEILNVSAELGILEFCMAMIEGGCHLSKLEWKEYVWNLVWRSEDERYINSSNDAIMYKVIERPSLLVWWVISDLIPSMMGTCEIMAKLVCDANLLKDSDYRLKRLSFSNKICTACELGIREDIKHLIMQCPHFEGIRSEMWDVLKAIEDRFVQNILLEPLEYFYVIMGKHPEEIPFESMLKIWLVSSRYITQIYKSTIAGR